MKLLLDTHILIWALNEDSSLPAAAVELILDANNTIYYSVASIWETAIKHAIHPDNVKFSAETLVSCCQEAGYQSLPVYDRHVFAMEELRRPDDVPQHHDPFDRIMIGQAKAENMIFLTHDGQLPAYEERCVRFV